MTEELHRIYGRARLDDRQINELVGLCRGLIADGMINQSEAEYLRKWLVANQDVSGHPIAANLLARVHAMLVDNVLDGEEAAELFETLRNFSGGDFELGELLKSSSLPLDEPAPPIECGARNFCFTGTFLFGSRKECEQAVERRGGVAGSLSGKTDYLVIGLYATGSWKHSCFGNKITHALELKAKGARVAIVSEHHWVDFVR